MTPDRALARLPDPLLVVGGYGYRNVGDEAMLAGLLQRLGRRRVTVVSRTPAETTALHGVAAIGVGAGVGALRRHRSLIIGGGGLFGRDMGLVGRLLPAYGLLAVALGKHVVLEGVGFDTAGRGPVDRAVGKLITSAERVAVRDRSSADVAASWGVRAVVGPDLSAAMPAAPGAAGERILRAAGVRFHGPVVGLALTAVNVELGAAIESAVVETVERMPELEFCLIPMSQHPFVPNHNDLLLARRIQGAAPRVRVVDVVHHPSAILAAFARLSAIVAMRYHSLLFAERAAIPVVPIAYAAKCETWLAERGIPSIAPSAPAILSALRAVLPATSVAS